VTDIEVATGSGNIKNGSELTFAVYVVPPTRIEADACIVNNAHIQAVSTGTRSAVV